MDQAKRLKELEEENACLKRLLADAELDKAILKEAVSGNFSVRSGVARWSNMCVLHSVGRMFQSVGRAEY